MKKRNQKGFRTPNNGKIMFSTLVLKAMSICFHSLSFGLFLKNFLFVFAFEVNFPLNGALLPV